MTGRGQVLAGSEEAGAIVAQRRHLAVEVTGGTETAADTDGGIGQSRVTELRGCGRHDVWYRGGRWP